LHRWFSFGEKIVKIGKLFGRDKPKPEEIVKCPYCGHENPKKYVENALLGKYYNTANWMGKFRCWGCGKHFWVVGQYGEIKYAKPFSDIRFA
jgi:uncharacterized protein with PIN domain